MNPKCWPEFYEKVVGYKKDLNIKSVKPIYCEDCKWYKEHGNQRWCYAGRKPHWGVKGYKSPCKSYSMKWWLNIFFWRKYGR